jgi:LysR family transcriptional regulator, glycine cleavage system transcriptional activator
MSQLPLRSVQAFVLVARFLSLQKAATALGITVPAVSRRIQLMERHLGTKLFDRLPRGLALTPAGESYIADLGPAWDAVQAATASARAPSRRNVLKVTVIPTFAVNWLMPRLARRRPVGMEVELETLPDIVDLSARADIDCAIRLGRGPWAGTSSQTVLPVEAYPVASPAFVADRRLRTPQDLARHTLIGSNHQPDFWPEWFRLSGLAAPDGSSASFDNLQLVYEAAANGLGIAIGLDPLVRPYLDTGRLVRLWPGSVTLSRSFHLVRHARRAMDRRIDRFRDWLLSEASYATQRDSVQFS